MVAVRPDRLPGLGRVPVTAWSVDDARRPPRATHHPGPARPDRAELPTRNVVITLLRTHDTTNVAAALRYNARKTRRILKLLELPPA